MTATKPVPKPAPGIVRKGHSYQLDGSSVPSVTNVISNGVPAPYLTSWAARTVAQEAVNRWDELGALPLTDRLDVLRTAHNVKRDSAANRGTMLHAVYEALNTGSTADVAAEHEHLARLMVKLAERLDMQALLVERPCFSRTHRYAGTPDLVAMVTIAGERQPWLLDLKTGSGVYDSHAIQLAAYRYAEGYLGDDQLEHPMPHIQRTGVIHLTPDAIRLVELDAGPLAYQTFLHAMHVAHWVNACSKAWRSHEGWPVGEAVAVAT